MKKTIFTLVLLAFIGLSNASAQVGIGTTSPDASAILELDANDKGFLPPRMTIAQRDAINGGAPAEGLTIFNTDVNCLQWFDGAFWYDACSGEISAVPNGNITVASPTYQGVSVINAQGIGYNGETVPATSTITVQLTNTNATEAQNYGLIATDPATSLEYSASGTIAAGATIAVVLNHNEPDIAWDFYGTITMPLEGTSSTLNLAPRIDVKSIPTTHPDWTFNDVTYGTQTWMDRNLGARRPAEAINDVLSYGNHNQWGRPADGHEITVWNGDDQTSGRGFEDTTPILFDNMPPETFPTPGHPNFITNSIGPFDWISPQASPDTDRWTANNQGPCPPGYHVPNLAEWNTADAEPLGSGNGTNGNNTTGWDNNVETYESALILPSAGFRDRNNGLLTVQGTLGVYWSSTVDGALARGLIFDSTRAQANTNTRGGGYPVRCLKD